MQVKVHVTTVNLLHVCDLFILSTYLDGIRYDFTENATEKLAHVHAVNTRSFSLCREGPGDEATLSCLQFSTSH